MENISAEKLRKMIYTNKYGDRVLYLRGKGLSKVPEAVTDLTELEELYLSVNYLKELPTTMNKLKNLKWLILNNNQFRELPHSICELSNLTLLSVHHSQLCVVPSNIKHLKKLRGLELDFNQLPTLPDEIGELKELRRLYVAGNPLTLEGMRKVVKLKNKMKFDTDVTGKDMKCSLFVFYFMSCEWNKYWNMKFNLEITKWQMCCWPFSVSFRRSIFNIYEAYLDCCCGKFNFNCMIYASSLLFMSSKTFLK